LTLRDAILDACQVLREGGAVLPEAIDHLEEQLEERKTCLLDQLGPFPAGLESLQTLLEAALTQFGDALQALRLASEDDAPELAGWIQEKTQDADESLRQVKQSLQDYSRMLSEESP
jgi:hypothetical protein